MSKDITIEQQVNKINEATKRACYTKESARQFLIDAGIMTGLKSEMFVWNIFNEFTGEQLLVITMPVNRTKSANGFYHRFWDNLKSIMASIEKVDSCHIKLKAGRLNKFTDRIIYVFPSGVIIDIPENATAYDYSIIIAQLKVIGMKFKDNENV